MLCQQIFRVISEGCSQRSLSSAVRAELIKIHYDPPLPRLAQLRMPNSTQLAARSLRCPCVGFKLLKHNLGSSAQTVKKGVEGFFLDESERATVQRTVHDCLKLVSLSILFVIPFAQILLPAIAFKFPHMMPSTFYEARHCPSLFAIAQSKQRRLARSWHKEIEDVQISDLVKDSDFPQAKEILAFQEGRARRLRLDSMSKHQLYVLAKLLELRPTRRTGVLKWQLRRYMTRIRSEDRDHVWEGVGRLSMLELAEACKKRAIPFDGITETEMQTHLKRWAQLSSQRDISMCLLLWVQSSFNLESQDGVECSSQRGSVIAK